MGLLSFLFPRRIAVTVALVLVAVPSWGVDGPGDRRTLKGITSFDVVVETLAPDAEQDGLTTSQLQTDVELRLRESGITVDRSSENYLYVNINTVKNEELSLYAYSLEVAFKQRVRLARDPKTSDFFATTWSSGWVGIMGATRLREMRSKLADHVDEFINAYLEQNPKK